MLNRERLEGDAANFCGRALFDQMPVLNRAVL